MWRGGKKHVVNKSFMQRWAQYMNSSFLEKPGKQPRESAYSHQTVNYSELESIRTRVFSHNKLSTYCEMDELMLVLYPISHCDAQDSIHKSCNPSFIHVAVIMIVAALHRALFSNKIPHLIFYFFL